MREDRFTWLILALIGVFSLWYPASGRTNNPLWLLLGAGCLCVLAYQLYGRFLFSRLLGEEHATRNAQHEPQPMPTWLAFAYQFAAIAGAGVLLGPVLATQFGWLPGVLWLILGAALAGAVQDMVILAATVRRGKESLTALVAEAAGPLAASTTWLLALAVLVLVLTTVGGALVSVLTADAGAAYILALTVPAALLAALHERVRPGRGTETTLVGLALFVLAIVLGVWLASRGPAPAWLQNRTTIVWLLAAYAAIAAVLPLPVLSRPRVAFSGLLSLAGAALLAVLLMVAAPAMHIQPTTQFLRGGGPLVSGAAFPTLGLLLALGAISGFNALVASGLTGRLVRRTGEALPVGYGAMLVAGFLALAALVTVATIWPGDLVVMITNIAPADLPRLTNLPVRELDRLNQLTKTSLSGQGSVAALAAGAAQAFAIFPGVRPVWSPTIYRLALALQALLLLAGLEAAGRLGRLALEEAGDAFRRFPALAAASRSLPDQPAWLGAAMASAVVALVWGGLLLTGVAGSGSLLGLAALLLAAVALALSSVLIVREKVGRQRLWALATALPLIAVLVFSLAGGVTLARDAWRSNSGKAATAAAYTYLPTLAERGKLVPVDRARAMVREFSADQAAEIYLAQGSDELAKALTSRFGGALEENTRLAQAVAQEATRRLWLARLQLVAVVLLVLLALIAVIATIWRGLAGPPPPAAPPPPPPPDDRWLGMNI